MKNVTCGLITILLMVISFAVARSLPNNYMASEQHATGENLRLARDADDSTSKTDNADPMVDQDQFMAEIANLSMPNYLKELFINLTHSNKMHDPSENDKVNTIRSYENQAKNIDCGYYKFHIKRHELDGEDVIRAELRLLQKSSMTLDSHYNVEIYYLLNKKAHESPLKLSFKHIDPMPGWKTFDITPIALNWKQGLVNHGLQIKLIKDGKMLSYGGIFSEETDSMEKSSLILFTHDHNSEFLQDKPKKDKISHVVTSQQRRKRNSNMSVSTEVPVNNSVTVQNVECHLKEMIVKAKSLSIGNVHLLLPKEINVGICSGHCTKFDYQSLQGNASTITSHADILSIYYHNTAAGLQKAPSRCCKATNFNMVPMVFYDETVKERFIKVNIPAQATECSCL